MRTSTKLPCSFSPASVNFSSPLRRAASTSSVPSGIQKPRSHSITVPPPYSPLGIVPFEVAIVERVVLDLDSEALVCRIEGWALGHRPGLEHAVVLEAKIVVQAGGGMLLDDKAGILGGADFGLRRSAQRSS